VAQTARPPLPVSSNNPCPFLRALVTSGQLADDTAPIGKVAELVVATARRGEGRPALPRAAIAAVALIANSLSPLSVLKTRLKGLRLNALRGGPLDKNGVGSGILDARGKVDAGQLARLREFAVKKKSASGPAEPGLGRHELRRFMDANFARAAGRRRHIDRALMNGEWPVLLKVLGKGGPDGRYLSLKEVETLFTTRQLPDRMTGAAAEHSAD
jgi:hypothetical protein